MDKVDRIQASILRYLHISELTCWARSTVQCWAEAFFSCECLRVRPTRPSRVHRNKYYWAPCADSGHCAHNSQYQQHPPRQVVLRARRRSMFHESSPEGGHLSGVPPFAFLVFHRHDRSHWGCEGDASGSTWPICCMPTALCSLVSAARSCKST